MCVLFKNGLSNWVWIMVIILFQRPFSMFNMQQDHSRSECALLALSTIIYHREIVLTYRTQPRRVV